MYDKLKLDDFATVAPGTWATVTFDPSSPLSVFGFLLKFGGTAFDIATDVEQLRVKSDSKDLLGGLTGAQLKTLLSYEGYTIGNDYLPILFANPQARTQPGMYLGNFDRVANPKPMQVQVKFASGAPGDSTVEGIALVNGPKANMAAAQFDARQVAGFRCFKTSLLEFTASGSPRKDVSMAGDNALLNKMAFYHGGIMTSLSLKRGGIELIEDIAQADMDFLQEDVFERVAQTNLYVYDRVPDGSVTNALPVGGPDWEIRPTVSGSGQINVVADLQATLADI